MSVINAPREEEKQKPGGNVRELEHFSRDFRLTPRWGAQLFGVSPRTWRRWRRRGVPARARQRVDDMIEICREGQAPITHSLPRGPWIGVQIYSWRGRLFGPDWRAWRAPLHGSANGYRRRRLP